MPQSSKRPAALKGHTPVEATGQAQTVVKQTAVEKTTVKQRAAKTPTIKQPVVKKSAVKKSAVEKSAVEKSAVKESAVKKPVVNKTPISPKRRRPKQLLEKLEPPQDSPRRKRPRTALGENTPAEAAAASGVAIKRKIDPIAFWVKEGRWPAGLWQPPRCHLPVIKSREKTSANPTDTRYALLLETKGTFMRASPLGIKTESSVLCQTLLDKRQTAPQGSLILSDEEFGALCERLQGANEARVIRDVTPLLVPSAEIMAFAGASHLACLVETVNEGWNNAIPLTEPRPQPDYSVGFAREAFTEDQLNKLAPFVGEFIAGDLSFFMATMQVYFPFFTCEVTCGAGGLDIADR
ncbi:hypothetical protein SPI_08947 [Niveomyces insectorum RCEF 264]|uniref:DUF7924 domain-containing protein n=1 Tax=Niveomyces insectorum RCEF 264 TaxID=1081102 RepID=A0A167MGM4_9HYPO|nr:hypothetical protein SPI_08947 [Niveomyces insectorum RCEF 264]